LNVALDAQWSAVARGYRFALILAFVVGVAAVAACALTGYPVAGLFICVGLGLGGWNSRRLWTDTEKLTAAAPETDIDPSTALFKGVPMKGPALAASGKRLALITVFAFLVALAYRPLGWTVFLGLVLFQVLMMATVLGPLRRVVQGRVTT
jgi:hypothetical protein